MKSFNAHLLIAMAVFAMMIAPTSAQTVKTLLAFNGSGNGQNSEGNLIWDSAGNLYGMTGDQFDPSVMKVFELSPRVP